METKPTPARSFGCATLAAIGAALLITYLAGSAWLTSLIPDPSISTDNLWLNLLRPITFTLIIGVPGALGVWLLVGARLRLWRGAALTMLALALYALPLGVLQAFERQRLYPGWPDWIPAGVWLGLSVLLILVLRTDFTQRAQPGVIWLGVAAGALVPLGYLLAGSLGTLGEAALALLDALALALSAALLCCLPFHFEADYPARRPLPATLYTAAVMFACAPTLLALRGFWIQGRNLSPVLGACGLVAGGLLVLGADPGVQRNWRAVLASLFVAMSVPLLLTDGLEGDWMPGEMSAAWSNAGYQAVLVALVVGFVLILGRDWLNRLLHMRWLFPALAGICLAALPVVYGLSAGPGFQPDSFLVVLNEQTDTAFARNSADWQSRREQVFTALVSQADHSQAGIRQWLDERQASYTPFYLVNALEVQGNGLRRSLAGRPEVDYLLESPQARPLRQPAYGESGVEPHTAGETTWNIEKIQADLAWNELHATGAGIVVGIADSGTDWTHPDLAANYRGADGQHALDWYDPWENTQQPTDDDGHGTGTAGVSVGLHGIGVAPGAEWIACRNLARNLGNPADYLRCMQFLFAPFPLGGDALRDGLPLEGAHITNNSWGCPPQEGCDLRTLGLAVEHVSDAGQMMVASAGNEGPGCATIGVPANSAYALSVGAVDQFNQLAYFSSRGPAEDGEGGQPIKPELVAPGEGVLTSWVNGGYLRVDGTSFAGPHIAGVVALMWSANPALIGNLEATRRILAETAEAIQAQPGCGGEVDGQNNATGFGVVNAYEAVKMALEYKR